MASQFITHNPKFALSGFGTEIWKHVVFFSPRRKTDKPLHINSPVIRYIDETSQDQTQYYLSFLKPNITNEFNNNSKRLKTTHYMLKKAYVSFNGAVGFDCYTIFLQTDFAKNATTAKVVGHYHEVVVTGYLWATYNFGHSISDFIIPLLLLPESIRWRSHIIVFSMPFLYDPFLDLLGFTQDRRIYLPENTERYIAADVLHCFANDTFYISQWGPNTYRFKRFVHQKLDLDKIPSTDYCFTNRPKGKARHIHNLDEIISATKSKFPTIDWKFVRDDHKELIECAKDFKKIKFLFGPVGSNLFKSIFMADHTVVICVTAFFLEHPLPYFCSSCKIFELQYDSITTHHTGVGSPIDVDDALFHIGKCLKVLETRTWKAYSEEDAINRNKG